MKPPFDQTKPFVGLAGTGNSITVIRIENKIVCRVSSWTYLFILSITAFFGPGVCALLWFQPEGTTDLSKLPVYLAALVLVLPVICCWAFIYNLFNHPRLEIYCESGDILFYKRKWGKPVYRLSSWNIEQFEIGVQWYMPSESTEPVKNHDLAVITNDAERIILCLSTSEALINSFADQLARLANKPVVETAL